MGLWRWSLVIALFVTSLVVTRWVVLPSLSGSHLHGAKDPVAHVVKSAATADLKSVAARREGSSPSVSKALSTFGAAVTAPLLTTGGAFSVAVSSEIQRSSYLAAPSVAQAGESRKLPPAYWKPVSFALPSDAQVGYILASEKAGNSDGQLYFNSVLPRATLSPEQTPSFAAVAHSDRQVALKGSEPPAGGYESGASVGFWTQVRSFGIALGLFGVIGLALAGVYLIYDSTRLRKRLEQSEFIRQTVATELEEAESEIALQETELRLLRRTDSDPAQDIPSRTLLNEAKRILQTWLDKQGHDRCWYYPDLFQELVKLFGLEASKPAGLPPLAEFREGCKRYKAEEYGLLADPDVNYNLAEQQKRGGFTPPTAPAEPSIAKFDAPLVTIPVDASIRQTSQLEYSEDNGKTWHVAPAVRGISDPC